MKPGCRRVVFCGRGGAPQICCRSHIYYISKKDACYDHESILASTTDVNFPGWWKRRDRWENIKPGITSALVKSHDGLRQVMGNAHEF